MIFKTTAFLIGSLAAHGACAQAFTGQEYAPRMGLLPGEGPCFAIVEIENRAGSYNATESLPTEYGPVLVAYDTIGAHGPGNDDLVTVVDLPPGVRAVPMEMAIPDDDTGHICLTEYVGG
mgnify:CR=1 FL=1